MTARARRLTVVSGKGGTGKTITSASFALLAGDAVTVDCDVDAADLHLLLQPETIERHQFVGGRVAARDAAACTDCGLCREACRFDAIKPDFDVADTGCEGCGFCARVCPTGAMKMVERANGEWFVSRTRCGTLVHARLGPAEENSGKLVTAVRNRAHEIAAEQSARRVIADGPPGIGCPTIAAITGADCVLAVTEPTPSGIHDLARLRAVVARFNLPMGCIVNRFDINASVAGDIEAWCRANAVTVIGRVPYDRAVVRAMLAGRAPVESEPGPARAAIESAWKETAQWLDRTS